MYIKMNQEITRTTKHKNINLSKTSIDLLNALRVLRLSIAKKQKLPAYTIFHDSALIQMSERKPINKSDMLDIDGVGPIKFKKYGLIFLETINKLK